MIEQSTKLFECEPIEFQCEPSLERWVKMVSSNQKCAFFIEYVQILSKYRLILSGACKCKSEHVSHQDRGKPTIRTEIPHSVSSHIFHSFVQNIIGDGSCCFAGAGDVQTEVGAVFTKFGSVSSMCERLANSLGISPNDPNSDKYVKVMFDVYHQGTVVKRSAQSIQRIGTWW